MKNTLYFLMFIALFSITTAAYGQVLNWTGNVNTDWNNPGNWSPMMPPSPGSLINIADNPNNNYPVIMSNVTIWSIGVFGGASLTIDGSASLTTNGTGFVSSISTSFYNAGTVTNSGTINLGIGTPTSGQYALWQAGGTFTNQSSGMINVSGSEFFGIFCSSTFTNNGDIVIGGDASPDMVTGIRIDDGNLTNNSNGSIEINRPTLYALHLTDASLDNSGDIAIGNNNASGTIGLIIDASSTVNNNDSASISIEDVSERGIENVGTINNNAIIDITLGVVDFGIINAGVFNNNVGSGIALEVSSTTADIYNFLSGTFNNYSAIDIGQSANAGVRGIQNEATFGNFDSGIIKIDRTS